MIEWEVVKQELEGRKRQRMLESDALKQQNEGAVEHDPLDDISD